MFAMNFVELGKPILMGWLKKRSSKKNKKPKNQKQEEVDNLLNSLEPYSCIRDRLKEPNEGTTPE